MSRSICLVLGRMHVHGFFAAVATLLTVTAAVGIEKAPRVKEDGHAELVNLLETSSTHAEAAKAFGNHHSVRFLVEKLNHVGLPFEQVLIDLYQQTTAASGECELSSWKYLGSCNGKHSACRKKRSNPCQGICRCNTVGFDECECVRELSEPMVEDDKSAFVGIITEASKDMVSTGEKVLKKVDKVVDKIGDKVGDFIDEVGKVAGHGINWLKNKILRKLDETLKILRANKHTALRQQKKVELAKGKYFDVQGKEEKRAAFKVLAHEIGILNGMEQVMAIKNMLKKAAEVLRGAGDYILPDMIIYGANYASALYHTAGVERVIDFRTREVASFKYGGMSVGTNQATLSVGAAAYVALGWQHSQWCKTLEAKYSGLFRTFDASVSIPGVTNFNFASVSIGGVAAVSAAGNNAWQAFNPTNTQCCPVWDAIKTLGFSVSGSLSAVSLPVGANAGCTDYKMINVGKHCSKSTLEFLKDQLVGSSSSVAASIGAAVMSPINLLLSTALTLANDGRVAEGVCKGEEPPEMCACNNLPKHIKSCGNRPRKACTPLFGKKYLKKKKAEIKQEMKEMASDEKVPVEGKEHDHKGVEEEAEADTPVPKREPSKIRCKKRKQWQKRVPEGFCIDVRKETCDQKTRRGYCPGNSNIRCCPESTY